MSLLEDLFTFFRYRKADGTKLRARHWEVVGATTEVDAATDTLKITPPGAATGLIGLADTPANYTSAALRFLRVNAAEDAVEFVEANSDRTANESGVAGDSVTQALDNLAASAGAANFAIWDPSQATAAPRYATLAEAVTALDGTGAGGTVFIPVSVTGVTVPAAINGGNKTRLVSIGPSRTITFAANAELSGFTYIGCPLHGSTLSLSDDGIATGGHLVEVTIGAASTTVLENVVKVGTSRPLVGTVGGSSIPERRLVLSGACNLNAGAVEGAGTFRVIFQGHGATLANGCIVNTSAHGRNLTVDYEHGQDYNHDDVAAGWATGSVFAFRKGSVSRRATFVNPQVFDTVDTVMRIASGGSGTLTVQPAASGHTAQAISNIVIHIEASSGYTALAVHADYGQDGTPLDTFDAAKGYLVFISRYDSGSGNVAYAVTGKVIAA